MQTGNIHGMINAVMQVMLNYNDGDPYRSLVKFAEVSEQLQPNGEQMERDTSPRSQYVSCNECEYEFEVDFPTEGEGDYASEECPDCEYEGEYEYYYD